MDLTLSGTTTLGEGWAGINENEEVLRVPQISCLTAASLSDCLMSYIGPSLVGGSYFTIFYCPTRMDCFPLSFYIKMHYTEK